MMFFKKIVYNIVAYQANQNKPTLCLTYVLTGFLQKLKITFFISRFEH